MFSQIPSRRGHRADAGARILTEKEAEHAPVAGREFDEDAEWGGEEGILGDSQATWSGDPANFANFDRWFHAVVSELTGRTFTPMGGFEGVEHDDGFLGA